ncbi:MAG: HIT family protein [Bacilli bacterium]|nr:HIT family protein [Bacilli bacterium]
MKDCIFCKIIDGEIPSRTVFEDEQIKIIMNINPATNGHLLVIPKEHMTDIKDTKEEVIMHSLKVIKEVIFPLLKERLNCEGLTIAQNNELGQEIKHYHIHLIPRYPNDNADFQYNKDQISDLDKIFNKLK